MQDHIHSIPGAGRRLLKQAATVPFTLSLEAVSQFTGEPHLKGRGNERNSLSIRERLGRACKVMITKWIPVVLWGGFIFYFSTDMFSSAKTSAVYAGLISRLIPSITPQQIEVIDLVVRKFGHLAEYFILAVLLLRALDGGARRSWSWRPGFWTLALVLLYAASDELHQAFVPSRSALLADVLIDFLGGVFGVLWMYTLSKRWQAGKQNRRDQRRDGS
jgi:VanZ family protein